MTSGPLVFCDANVLFSMALGGEAFALMLELAERGRVRYVTSRVCALEAERNLLRKRPEAAGAIDGVMAIVAVADVDPSEHLAWAAEVVGASDAHVLAAARSLHAAVLVTGDRTHFGTAMERTDLPLRIRTPRTFLLEGSA